MTGEPLKTLKALLSTSTPSGYESPGVAVLKKYMGKYADEVKVDVHGNLHGVLNPKGKLKVMLAGHVDEIGLMVMHVDDKGYVYFSAVGGVNLQLLQGEQVTIHGPKGPIPGVIGVKPIHLMSAEERTRGVKKASELWIDIGAADKKEALRYVRPGDVATVNKGWFELRNDKIAARGFDDRIGAFIVSDVLRLLKRRRLNVAVHAVATVQEEIGLRGAKTAAGGIDPDVGIAVDVGFASDMPGVDAKIVGECKVGLGPNIHRGPNFNHKLFDKIEAAATKAKVPTQLTGIPRGSGTDANAIQLHGAGVAAALISIPNRYMHSPVEVISLKDVENAVKLIAETVASLKATDRFVP